MFAFFTQNVPWCGFTDFFRTTRHQREKNPGSKVALLFGNFGAIWNFLCHAIDKLYYLCVWRKISRHTLEMFRNAIFFVAYIQILYSPSFKINLFWKHAQFFLEMWKFFKHLLETSGHTHETLSNLEFRGVVWQKTNILFLYHQRFQTHAGNFWTHSRNFYQSGYFKHLP